MAGDDGHLECTYCGRRARSHPPGWCSLDLESDEGVTELHWYRGFCSTEHAAAWLARPLPAPDRVQRAASDWRDWRFYGGLLAAITVCFLATAGMVTISSIL
ncbi:hypothetical protein ACTHAM_001148 [Cellulomonas soli]|uniref:hypothetical protein n=1 Tax=Cellulomonas soli TaxID=931535 RepID=UPI003F83AEDA